MVDGIMSCKKYLAENNKLNFEIVLNDQIWVGGRLYHLPTTDKVTALIFFILRFWPFQLYM